MIFQGDHCTLGSVMGLLVGFILFLIDHGKPSPLITHAKSSGRYGVFRSCPACAEHCVHGLPSAPDRLICRDHVGASVDFQEVL